MGIEQRYESRQLRVSRLPLTKQEVYENISFWETTLRGFEPLEFPRDKVESVGQSREEARQFLMPRSLYNKVQSLCESDEVSVYLKLLTAFQILLYRYTSQKDITTGTTVFHEHSANQRASFWNKLPVRNEIMSQDTFLDVAKPKPLMFPGRSCTSHMCGIWQPGYRPIFLSIVAATNGKRGLNRNLRTKF